MGEVCAFFDDVMILVDKKREAKPIVIISRYEIHKWTR